MVRRVLRALSESRVERTVAVTSPHAPETASSLDVPTIETGGDGYVADLQTALADDRISQPVLSVAADLPLLAGGAVDAVLDAHDGGSLTTVVPVGRVRALGFSADTPVRHRGALVRPAGVNVVADDHDSTFRTRDRRLAANVNRPRDLAVARWRLAGNRSVP
jgi:adenosylcobinamide-phosphate guanylyltransferase